MAGKFTQGLMQHIKLEKDIPFDGNVQEDVERRVDKTMGEHCLGRIKMLLKYGLSEEKIRKANVRDVSICIAILLKKSKELGVVEEEKEVEKGEKEDIGEAITNITKQRGIFANTIREKITSELPLSTDRAASRTN